MRDLVLGQFRGGNLVAETGRLRQFDAAAADFELSDDTCSGTTLAPGAA